jgi:hypothetical protein
MVRIERQSNLARPTVTASRSFDQIESVANIGPVLDRILLTGFAAVHLRSARRDAHWHPFTGLIEHEGIVENYEFHALPFVSDPPRMEDRSVATIIHHELTHHASARTTRLGFAYSAEAARLLRAFRDGSELNLTSPAIRLLGTFLPILEGLAVYAELDADEAPGDVIIPNPIPMHVQMMEFAWHRSSGDILRLAREEQIYETPDKADGLLRFLFADPNSPETGVYLIGYLWIKAAVAHIRRINASLARPTIVLPLLIKLFCDHPVIVDVWRGDAGETEIIGRLRESILSLDRTALARVEKALGNKDDLGTFELWDLHGFLADESLVSPRLDEESLRPFFAGGQPDELETQLRLGASIHFPSRVAGVITEVKRDDRNLELEIETEPGKHVQAFFLSLRSFWNLYYEIPHYRPVIEKHAATAARLEDAIWGLMEEWKGQRITLARYWGISDPPLPGIVVWHEDGRMVHLPYEPHWYEFQDHIELTKFGLGISIDEKQRFAKALSSTPVVTSLARRSANVLLSHLVSNERARTSITHKRLGCVLSPVAREALESWVAFPLFPAATWRLGEPASSELTRVFDMPAFPSLHSDFTFAELLPALDRPRSSQGANDE